MTDKTSIKLGPEDPTIFARCPNCCKSGKGIKQGRYFARAYTLRRFRRTPKCENCGSLMEKLYEIKIERRDKKRK